MKKAVNHICFALLTLVSLLPFWILYGLSEFLFLLIFYAVKYRKKTVLKNLCNSFPEKDHEEIQQIAKKFYRHFCDLLVEAIKLKTISTKNLEKRMVVTNPELVNKYFDQGKSVLVLSMHYNNWEWLAILPHYLKHRLLLVYKPVRNSRWSVFINRIRTRFGGELVPTKKILKTVLKYQQEQIPTFTWLCADQRPKTNARFRTSFLKQETNFFPGSEALARHTNHVVLYQHIEKIKRGHYQTSFGLLTENPAKLAPGEVLHLYVHKIENLIKARPEFYLWSHKRWKNK